MTYGWYQKLIKPAFAPPAYLFGIVWSILYPIILATFAYVFYLAFNRTIPMIVALPFALNLLFNLAFSPIQFSLQNNLLASIDIVLVVATLAWALYWIYPYSKFVFYANLPYLFWVMFATVLQLSITYLNWR